MTDRRGFLGALLGVGAVGALRARPTLAGPGTAASPVNQRGARAPRERGDPGAIRALEPVGVQLYTVRSLMDDDVAGTLAAVAAIGYREVETAGLHGLSPAAFRQRLDDHGLRAVSGHVPLESLEGELDRTLDDAATLGQGWVTVPWLAVEARTADGYRRTADALNRAGDAARAAGLRVAYHNHEFEFTPLADAGGRSGWELLLEATDPALVDLQLDLFWAVHAGTEPTAWFERHPGRFPMVHAKDRTAAGDMVDVGDGVLDFAGILAAGRRAGLRHVLVEHDRPDDPLASVTRSYETLAALEV